MSTAVINYDAVQTIVLVAAQRSRNCEFRSVWKGYLFALFEWKFLDAANFQALRRLLTSVGDEEVAQTFVVLYPDGSDQPHVPEPSQLMQQVASRLAKSRDSDTIHLLMKGYTAALQLSQFYEFGEYSAQRAALKPIGDDELDEIFLGWNDEEVKETSP